MAAALRVNPKDYFPAEVWASLTARSSWKGIALIAHCWAVIGAASVMALKWPLTLPLAVMVIGARQLGLGILQHDAAHGALHPNLKVNDILAEWFCASGVERYRTYHLKHHRFAQQSEDPDLVLSAPFPVTPQSFRRKVVRDLTGQTWFKDRFGRFAAALKARRKGTPLTPILAAEWRRQRRWVLVNGAAIILFSAAGYPWGWFAVWLLPRATWYQLITRVRNIAEHALIARDEPDPLRQARTTRANWIERMLIAPYWVNYHCEHHMFMHAPCWSLPAIRRHLDRSGVTARMEGERGYAAVLQRVIVAGA